MSFCLSIIIPIYKVEQYVRKCIQSIIEQEDCGAPIECIIVDDCSPDNSMLIIQSLLEDYRGSIKFVFLSHERNKGLSAARNTGIDAIHGDYVMFVDSDDWLPTGSIFKFVKVLQENPQIDIVIGNRIRTRDNTLLQNKTREITLLDNLQIRKLLLNYQIVTCSAWNKVIKTDIIKSNKFHEGIIFEDTPWAYSLFKNIKTALIIPDVTYIYENNHPASIINTSKSIEHLSIHIKSVSYIGNAILDEPYLDLFADSLFYLFRLFIVAFRLQYEYNLAKEECKLLKQLRKRLILSSLKYKRWFLSFYFYVLTYPPTSYLFNIGWFRRHYNNIEKAGRVIANCFEKFHRSSR